jgi:Fe2+-dicitrate sensor, membrane component
MQSLNSDIIKKVIAETASKKEATDVIEWFSSSIEGQQCLSDMMDKDSYLMETEPYTGKSLSPLQSDLLFSRIDRQIRNNRTRRITLKAAAIFLPLLLFIGLGVYLGTQSDLFGKTTYTELYVPKGEDARIFFQDGTEVFLNADTRIRYPEKFGLRKREVYVDGEAYFNVASNKKRPFVVHAHTTEIEVLGTSFNVNAYGDNDKIQVVLDEGKVAFQTQQNSYSMRPGQKILYDKVTGRTTVQNLTNSSHASLWKNDFIYFYDTPLAEVMKILERKYNVKFDVHTPDALKYTYTLTTKQASIENVLQELQKITPVRFRIQDDIVNVFISE